MKKVLIIIVLIFLSSLAFASGRKEIHDASDKTLRRVNIVRERIFIYDEETIDDDDNVESVTNYYEKLANGELSTLTEDEANQRMLEEIQRQKETGENTTSFAIGIMIDKLNNTFKSIIYSHNSKLQNNYKLLFRILLILEITWLGLMSITKGELSGVKLMIALMKVLFLILVVFYLTGIVEYALKFVADFSKVMGKPESDSIKIYTPGSDIMAKYREVTGLFASVVEKIGDGNKVVLALANIIKILVEMFLFMVFLYLSLNVLVAYIELYLLVILISFLLPFNIFEPSKWIGANVWQALVGQIIKLFAIMLILGLSGEIFNDFLKNIQYNITDLENINNWDYLSNMIIYAIAYSAVFAYIIITIPSLVKALITGTPHVDSIGNRMILGPAAKAGALIYGGGKFLGKKGIATAAKTLWNLRGNKTQTSGGIINAAMKSTQGGNP